LQRAASAALPSPSSEPPRVPFLLLITLLLGFLLQLPTFFSAQRRFVRAFRKNRRISKLGDLALDPVRTCLDRHTGAVKTKRKEDFLSLETLIADSKLGFGESERVTKMQTAVHVRIRERCQVLRLRGIFGRIVLKDLFMSPLALSLLLKLQQLMELCT